MKITPNSLSAYLTPLKHAYVLSGDEPFLQVELGDRIRRAARETGLVRQRYDIHASLQRSILSNDQSLFNEKYLLECDCTVEKLTADTFQLLTEWINTSSHYFLFLLPKLDAQVLKTKYMTNFLANTVFIPIWPIDKEDYPNWVRERLQAAQLPSDATFVSALSQLTEGNLLACKQLIDRLPLLHTDRAGMLRALDDEARFTVFDWIHHLLQGDAKQAVHRLHYLQEEDEPILPLYALAQECRLALLAKETQQSFESFCAEHKIWPKRQRAFKQFLNRSSKTLLESALQRCTLIDRCVKGVSTQDPWQLLENLTVELTCQH